MRLKKGRVAQIRAQIEEIKTSDYDKRKAARETF